MNWTVRRGKKRGEDKVDFIVLILENWWMVVYQFMQIEAIRD